MLKKIKMNLRQVEKWKVEARCESVVLYVSVIIAIHSGKSLIFKRTYYLYNEPENNNSKQVKLV